MNAPTTADLFAKWLAATTEADRDACEEAYNAMVRSGEMPARCEWFAPNAKVWNRGTVTRISTSPLIDRGREWGEAYTLRQHVRPRK